MPTEMLCSTVSLTSASSLKTTPSPSGSFAETDSAGFISLSANSADFGSLQALAFAFVEWLNNSHPGSHFFRRNFLVNWLTDSKKIFMRRNIHPGLLGDLRGILHSTPYFDRVPTSF